jgi:molybdopterin synthase sulfur carrier subunit
MKAIAGGGGRQAGVARQASEVVGHEPLANGATLLLPGALRPWAGGRSSLPLEGATVGEMLDVLALSAPQLEWRLRDEQGQVRRHVQIFVGDTNIRDAAGLQTPVPDGGCVYIIPAVAGG